MERVSKELDSKTSISGFFNQSLRGSLGNICPAAMYATVYYGP